jgi:hypothetical protein
VKRIARLGLSILCMAACTDREAVNGAGGAGEPGELRALVDSLLPSLERLSGLTATGPVRVERRSPAQVRAYVQQQLAEELPPRELAGVQATYALLGLVPDTLDLGALLLDLYTEQIVGYYDPLTKTLYAVDGVAPEALRPVVAHELVHALQDQHANLDSLISRERGNDRQLAAQAAIEGHATLVMFALLAGEAAGQSIDPATLPNPAEQLRAAMESPGTQLPIFRSAPPAMREMLLFPYVSGASFVQALWRGGSSGDERTPPLGSALPQSTEQVLWPFERYVADRDPPTELVFGAASGSPTLYENTLGAFETRLFLEQHLGLDDARGRGWDGDRYRLVEAPSGEKALVWYSIWDDDAAADAFTAGIHSILGSGSLEAAGDVRRITLDGRPVVRVVLTHRGTDPGSVRDAGVDCADEHGNRRRCGNR